MKNRLVFMMVLISALLLSDCTKDEPIEEYVVTPYELTTPYGFPELIIPGDNPMTVEGVELGRMLYYDPIIDGVNTRSCGSCHVQGNAFTSVENCLTHINLAWNNAFLWNGKIEGSLEDIMMFEVEEFFETDVSKLNSNSEYSKLFREAFGTAEITSKEVAFALAQFFRTLISSDSKFDQYQIGNATLTEAEARGLIIYFSEDGDCFHCHGTRLLTDNQFHNNGLDVSPENGRAEITGDPNDQGKFKTPTLRNIEYSGPYMHDGRYNTLEEVIDFYSEGLLWSPTIDPLMKKVDQGGLQLSPFQKQDLLVFLKTFSDETFVVNPEYSDPF
ncbi:MAG: cytochrome-c peroxidase [Chitinophagales bacterium]|nr:cytochrome-c peroxidase [Chitinophagales bacterium]